MDIRTQERAIKGLIAFWEDIYFVQGKEYVAYRFKPGIQDLSLPELVQDMVTTSEFVYRL